MKSESFMSHFNIRTQDARFSLTWVGELLFDVPAWTLFLVEAQRGPSLFIAPIRATEVLKLEITAHSTIPRFWVYACGFRTHVVWNPRGSIYLPQPGSLPKVAKYANGELWPLHGCEPEEGLGIS